MATNPSKPGAQPTYAGDQHQPGTNVDPTLRSGPPAAEADATADANPRGVTGDAPPPNRPIGSPATPPIIGAAGAAPMKVQVVDQDPEDKARAQFRGRDGVDLLLEACRRFGINPDSSLPIYDGRKNKPADAQTRAFRQLLSWQPYPADASAGGFDSVVLVTAGGVKLGYSADPAHRLDEDTQTRLRQAFGAFRLNPVTREMEAQPLPADLALPLPALLGFPVKADHVYQRGYAASGGREEADRRDARAVAKTPAAAGAR